MSKSRVPAGVCMLFMLVPGAFGRSQDSESLGRLRNDYQTAIEKIRSLYSTMHGTGTRTQEYSIGTPQHRTATSVVEFARKPGMFRSIFRNSTLVLHKQGAASQRSGAVLCYNRSLGFMLKKPLNSESYVITSTGGIDQNDLRSILKVSRIVKFLDCPYWMPGALGGPSIPDYLSKPEFVLENSERVTVGDKNLLKIYFKFKPAESAARRSGREAPEAVKKPRSSRMDSGWLLVSPEDGWVLHQGEVHDTRSGDGSTVLSFSVEYEGSRSGTPMPKRAELTTSIRIYNDKKEATLQDGTVVHDGDVASKETFEFDNISFDEVPDREFTLPAFGLPDLGSPDRLVRRDYSFVWMFVVAFLALVVALGLKYYASRTGAPRGADSTA